MLTGLAACDDALFGPGGRSAGVLEPCLGPTDWECSDS